MTAALHLLPLVPNGTAPSRTVTDRLELLHTLIAAPTSDPMFREDVITVPGDHPVYGWQCHVQDCRRATDAKRDFCLAHSREWGQAKKAGVSTTEFMSTAQPLAPRSLHTPPDCLVCPDLPARGVHQLCYLHDRRWMKSRMHAGRTGRTITLDAWVAQATSFPSFGACRVRACPERAGLPQGLCYLHHSQYEREGRPGGARVPKTWTRTLAREGRVEVLYTDEAEFRSWCSQTAVHRRGNGVVSLLELRPLAKAEIQWTLGHHARTAEEGASWSLAWIRLLAERCREQDVVSLADLDLDISGLHARQVARVMLKYLRLVYFSREDTKAAGFLETDHFGIRFPSAESHINLAGISQRWLRDLLWDDLAAELIANPPRSRGPIDVRRRGCIEFSAFLQARAPQGGNDPTLLDNTHMADFIADQRHRGKNGLPALAIRTKGPDGVMSEGIACDNLNGVRRLLRAALENGASERIGLDRAFIVELPRSQKKVGRRRPFSDEVARALAAPVNLTALEGLDCDDRGLRDAWEALVVTGRRCQEVLNVRLECIDRLRNVPMFWHDQTKVGNFDEGIRISERLFQRLQVRQAKTVDRFVQRHGRPPTKAERAEIALFPRATCNRRGNKGVSYGWFSAQFSTWVKGMDLKAVAHQARHTLATNLLKAGANLTHVKRYLGQISEAMAEHYVHIANTDPRLNAALEAVWVAGPGALEPGILLSDSEPMSRERAEALLLDLNRMSTPAEGGFCTFQPVVNGDACPWNMDCHNCDKFVLSGADLVYWHRKREQWRMLAERAPDPATADFLHNVFEPTARAIDGLEKALAALGLLEDALAIDLRRPQDYFGRVWATAFRAQELAHHENETDEEAA